MSDELGLPRPLEPDPIDDRLTLLPVVSMAVTRLVFRILARIRFEGLENVPKGGPVIIAMNHSSNADALLVGSWIGPQSGRRTSWLAKAEALGWPIVGPLMRANGTFGIDRGAADIDAFRAAKRVLEHGHALGVLPEGTRSPTGMMQAAKDGATLLALRTGAPILPIGISGTDRFWPKHRRVFRPGGTLTVRIGQPFTLEPLPTGVDRRAALEAATTELMRHIAELVEPRQRGVYAAVVEEAARARTGAQTPAPEGGRDAIEREHPAPVR